MQTKRQNIFTTIRTEGAILPVDLLQRVAEGDADLDGLKPEDYHLVGGEKLTRPSTGHGTACSAPGPRSAQLLRDSPKATRAPR